MMVSFAVSAWCQWKEPPTALPDTFTIGLQASDRIVESDYALAAEAGFNLVVPVRPGQEPSQALLKACSAAGIKAIVWDSRLSTYDLSDWDIYNQAFAAYRDSRAVAGYMVYDSIVVPPARLAGMGWHMRELGGGAPEKYRYAEAVPMSRMPDANAYRRYVRSFFMSGGALAVYEETDPFSAAALEALKITGEAAKDAMRAAAEGARSRGRGGAEADANNVRVWWRRCRLASATPEMIRWQAYSAAAAGAKGIVYLIARPLDTGNPATSRSDSLLDSSGKPVDIFETAKAVNARLAAMGPALMKAADAALYTVGAMPANLPSPDDAPITGIKSSIEGDGFLAGVLTGADGRLAMVVRKPSAAAVPADLTIQFAPGVSGTIAGTGKPAERLTLLPGEGALLQIK